jgi:DNA-binding NtrC family response regulator
VSVAAAGAVELEGLCDLLALAGHRVVHRQCGRPRLDETAPALVWDVRDLTAQDTEWLRVLTANRPGLLSVILDSFPRGDSVLTAMRAGAAAVLGRPVCLEALAGTLLAARTAHAGHAGLGEASLRR